MTAPTLTAAPTPAPPAGSRWRREGPPPTTPPSVSTLPAAEALVATLLLTAVTLGAATSCTRMFKGSLWVLPVLGTAAIAHAVGWAARRARIPTAPAVLIGFVAVGLVGLWLTVGGSTTYGLPLGSTWTAVHRAFLQASRTAPVVNPPVPDLVGFRLWAAWVAGLVAVLGDWAAFRLRMVLQAVAPAVAVFVVACILGAGSGRALCVLALLVALVAFILVQRTTVGRVGTVWCGELPPSGTPWPAGLKIGAIALAAALITLPMMSDADGHGPLGWKHGGLGGSGSGARSVISPIVDLETRLVTEPQRNVMIVASPVASYWRLTSLDTFTGAQWQSTNSYYPVGHHLPGVASPPAGTRQVKETFHLQTLASIWLPAAFNPESVSGGGKVTWDPVSGSLLTNKTTADGLSYTVTSLQYLASLEPADLEAAPAPRITGPLVQDVQLPGLDPSVRQLAEQITAGQKTEYGKALALQNWFHGSQFTYSLDPPYDGYGTQALTTFLFYTKTGYCQQFAGAYAVLARSIGLPTRLAVGFTTGTSVGPDRYQVTDADAHTWPEVYFPGYGWVPFEPTKGNFQVPGAGAYTGDTTATAPGGSDTRTGPPAGTGSSPQPRQAKLPDTTTPSTTAPATTLPHPQIAGGRSSGSSAAWWLVPVGLVVAVGAGLGAVALGRRRRHRRRLHLDPRDRVLVCWDDTEALLAWCGVHRGTGETVVELARRGAVALADRTVPGESTTHTLGQLPRLAGWATAAGYGDTEVPAELASEAEAGLDGVAALLRSGAPWWQRLRWWSDPRLVWV